MSKSREDPSITPPASLVRALEKVLRPIIRVLLHYQFTYPQFISLLKFLYVDVAESEMQIGNKRQSDSRINLLTGVHRKDVKRLRAESKTSTPVPESVSAGAKLIAHWLGNSQLVDSAGKPVPLPLRSDSEESISFEELVASVVKQDIRPRVILDEWQRLGIAHIEEDYVVLDTGAFTPDKGFDEKAYFFGKNLQDHASAGASNLMGLKPSYFDRSVYYDQLSSSSIAALDEKAHEIGMEALTAMNKAALELQQKDADNANATYRMNFGIFHYDDIARENNNEAGDD